jgi:pyrroloquinoline quinone biosynthesis protein B
LRVRFLGTAAGGGLPQWNCACTGCAGARRTHVGRTQDCLAISGDGSVWYLVNASPDLRTQIISAPELAPGPGLTSADLEPLRQAARLRDTPLRGVLFTSAELDHTLGLLTLREAASLHIYATGPVRAALEGPFPAGPILSRYTTIEWHEVVPDGSLDLAGGLTVRAVTLGAKRPRYADGLPGDDWVVAYRFTDPVTGGVLVYAPCLARWSEAFDRAIAHADVVVLDGTFLHDDEMTRETGTPGRPASSMGHLPIEDTVGRLPSGTLVLYTHLNNTNPAARPGAAPLSGAEIAADGQVLEL